MILHHARTKKLIKVCSLGLKLGSFPKTRSSVDSGAGGVARDRVDAALPQLPQKLSSGWSFSPHFLQNIVTLPPPVYANYADAKWVLMPNYYPELGFRGIMGVHFTNKKDRPRRWWNTHATLTQTLYRQRRAEIDSIRPAAPSAGLFCCPENGGGI